MSRKKTTKIDSNSVFHTRNTAKANEEIIKKMIHDSNSTTKKVIVKQAGDGKEQVTIEQIIKNIRPPHENEKNTIKNHSKYQDVISSLKQAGETSPNTNTKGIRPPH